MAVPGAPCGHLQRAQECLLWVVSRQPPAASRLRDASGGFRPAAFTAAPKSH